MMLKYLLLFIVFCFACVVGFAQSECNTLLEKAKKSHTKGDYADAFAKYRAVKLCAPDRIEEIEQLIAQLFIDVNGERERATQAQQQTEIALRQMREEQAKNKRILNKIYFYENKLGLAYQNNRYGFIDKNGNTIIQFDYTLANPFNELGFAYVEKAINNKSNNKLWIDTLGQSYNVAESLTELDYATQVLDLSDMRLDSLHDSIYKYSNIEIIKLRGIKHIPEGIGNLAKLKILACEECKFSFLPNDITQCKDLQKLILRKSVLEMLPNDIANLQSLQILDLKGAAKLTKLPNNIDELAELRYLNLSEAVYIKKLPKSISNLKRLEYLNLHFIKLPMEDILNLKSLEGLTYLNLNENDLSNIPIDFFCNFPNLEKLHIGGTRLTKMPNLECLHDLKTLTLGYNPLKDITLNLAKIPNLEQLDLLMLDSLKTCNLGNSATSLRVVKLSSKSLITIPDAIINAPNLEWLELSELRIKKFPQLAAADNIQQLSLDNMPLLIDIQGLKLLKNLKLLEISSCPKSFEASYNTLSSLENLVVLKLHHNQITNLTNQFGNFNKLIKLELIGNQFDSVPSSLFTSCRKLQTLKLQNNKLAQLPEEMGELANLEYLNLADNYLTKLPNSFGKLQHLKSLELSNNPLESLPNGLTDLVRLMSLRADGCRLKSLPPNLGNLTELMFLSLNNIEQLSELPASFTKLINLQQCNINNTCLQKIPNLATLKNLRICTLRNNNLSEDTQLRIKNELPFCKELSF